MGPWRELRTLIHIAAISFSGFLFIEKIIESVNWFRESAGAKYIL